MFLSNDDLQLLTGQRASSAQIRWLINRNIPFEINRQGRPVVLAKFKDKMTEAIDITAPHQKLQQLGAMAEKEEVISTAIRAPILSGVYFLVLCDNIIYIGQSENILYRIGTHSRHVEFDHFTYIPCPEEKRLSLEQKLIKKFNPPLNVNGKITY